MLRERTDINASETLVQEAHQFADPLKTMEDLDPHLERIGEARIGSWEDVLHQASVDDELLLFDQSSISEEFRKPRGHRAIGVVYQPERESYGNYVPTILPKRCDAFLYIDETEALHPLHIEPVELNPPDTYPWGV